MEKSYLFFKSTLLENVFGLWVRYENLTLIYYTHLERCQVLAHLMSEKNDKPSVKIKLKASVASQKPYFSLIRPKK
jgi:hypothetical protein